MKKLSGAGLTVFICLLATIILVPDLVFASAAGETPHPLTFKEFYQKVLAYYPKLKQQDANINLAIARKLQAVAGFLPRLQGSASVTRGDDPMFVFGSLMREDAFTQDDFALSRLNTPRPRTSYNLSLEGQMPIFDAFQTISRVKSAKLQIDSARLEETFTRMEAYLVAAEAYLRAQTVEKLSQVAEEVSEASAEDIRLAEDLKEKGLIFGADFYSAKVMHGNMLQLKNRLYQEKQAAFILLNILMGKDALAPLKIDSSLGASAQESGQLQDWFGQAYQNRADFLAMDKLIQAQGIDVSREKSSALPRVDAFGEARQDTGSFHSDGGQNYTVGVKAQMDLFDPAYPARLRVARERLKNLEAQRAMLKDAIAKDLTNEYAYYRIIQDNLPVIQKMLEDARQAQELMLPLYREGRKSIADLLEIRASYLNTAREYFTLAAGSKTSRTRLLFLSGQLDEARMNAALAGTGE